MFVAVTPSVVGNSTEILRWSDEKVAEKIHQDSRRRNKLVLNRDIILTDQQPVMEEDEDNDPYTIKTPTPKLVSLQLSPWDIAVVKTSHHFHRRGATMTSNFTRLTLNIDLADATDIREDDRTHVNETDKTQGERNEFVCIDTVRSMEDDRICGTDIIDNMYEQDIVLVGNLY